MGQDSPPRQEESSGSQVREGGRTIEATPRKGNIKPTKEFRHRKREGEK